MDGYKDTSGYSKIYTFEDTVVTTDIQNLGKPKPDQISQRCELSTQYHLQP